MFDINTLTTEQKTAYRTLLALQEILKNANVDTAEVAQYTDMILQVKRERNFINARMDGLNLIIHSS